MSSSTTKSGQAKRGYRLAKRAFKQEETRLRIVAAAVDLHSSVGPALTTVSQIAERAGVQRHTYYAHFPDERSLFLACSALAMERDPLPEIERLRAIPAGHERVARGLEQIYGWYARNRQHAACVLRDADRHALTREMVELRIAPTFRQAEEIMGEGLNVTSQTLLGVALDFPCWRKLSETHSAARAARLMSDAIIRVASGD
jgi:AcrR family transcriptional regulator